MYTATPQGLTTRATDIIPTGGKSATYNIDTAAVSDLNSAFSCHNGETNRCQHTGTSQPRFVVIVHCVLTNSCVTITGGFDLAAPGAVRCHYVDLVFIVDSSGSIGPTNWQDILQFMASIVNVLTIGPNDAQVGQHLIKESVMLTWLCNVVYSTVFAGGGGHLWQQGCTSVPNGPVQRHSLSSGCHQQDTLAG